LELRNEAAQFHFWEYINWIFGTNHSGKEMNLNSIVYPRLQNPSQFFLDAENICILGTPTKSQVSKRPVSKRLKRQVYKTSGLQNFRFTKCQVYKTSGLQNIWLKKNILIYSVLVVGGNPQVLLQPC
jgi:hypothetical protein